MELARIAGLHLDPWQVDAVELILSEGGDGKWAALESALIVPRQNGKGAILEAITLYFLFVVRAPLILHSAHEFKTATDAFARLLSRIESSPELWALVSRVHRSHGQEGIELHPSASERADGRTVGPRIKFIARTRGSGRGFSCDLLICDEAYDLSDDAIAALLPTTAARPNPLILYTSSAPLDDPRSDVLRRICKRGRRGSDRLCYIEYCADERDDRTDPCTHRKANPSLGSRLNPTVVTMAQASMSPEMFDREILGIWNEDPDEADKPIPTRYWVACERSHDPERPALTEVAGPISISLDIPPSREWTHFAVCGKNGEGLDQGELAGRIPGTELAVGRAKELTDRYGCKLLIAKGSPAWSLEPDLIRAGVPLRPISTDEQSQASADFYDAVLAGTFAHLGDPLLTKAVDGAATRVYGDAWLWSRRKAGVDIAPLVAVTLARWGLVSPLAEEPKKPIFAY